MAAPDSPTASPKPEVGAPRVRRWHLFRRTLVDFDRGKINAARGLRNALGVALPLAAGAWMHEMQPALVVATGALNVGFADSTEPYLPRVRRMLAACVLVSLAVVTGSLSGWTVASAILAAGVWAFGAGMLVSLGTQVGNLGVSCTCVLLIFAAHPLEPREALLCGVLALCGGLLQVGLSALLWALDPYEPERLALAALYQGLARLSGRTVAMGESPPGTVRASAASEALAARQGDHSLGSERYRALLDQGERIRVCLLTLRTLRERVDAAERDGSIARLLDEYFAAARAALEEVGEMLRTGKARVGAEEGAAGVKSHAVAQAERSLDAMRRMPEAGHPRVLMGDIEGQMDALNRQLRVTLELAKNSTRTGLMAFARSEAARPWRLRPSGELSTLRANLSLSSTAFRHAVRLAVCVMAADGLGAALGRTLAWVRPYWLPLTVVVVLKPDFSSTFSRGVLRLAGTFVGLVMATLLFHGLPRTLPVEIGLIMAVTFILRWTGPAHYGLLAMCVSELVVLLVALTGVEPGQVIVARARNTALGGALALTAYWLWPTWERTQVGEIFARMLDAYRRHFELLTQAFAGEGPELTAAMDKTRSASRLARTNVEASVDRLAAEPATTGQERDRWHARLASSHIFANAMIMLHARLLAEQESLRPLARNGTFQEFVRDVLTTLEGLAAQLRGVDGPGFPDLRAAHYKLVSSGEPMAGRHTLISVETDKMVNSLNTLREQVLEGKPKADS